MIKKPGSFTFTSMHFLRVLWKPRVEGTKTKKHESQFLTTNRIWKFTAEMLVGGVFAKWWHHFTTTTILLPLLNKKFLWTRQYLWSTSFPRRIVRAKHCTGRWQKSDDTICPGLRSRKFNECRKDFCCINTFAVRWHSKKTCLRSHF